MRVYILCMRVSSIYTSYIMYTSDIYIHNYVHYTYIMESEPGSTSCYFSNGVNINVYLIGLRSWGAYKIYLSLRKKYDISCKGFRGMTDFISENVLGFK